LRVEVGLKPIAVRRHTAAELLGVGVTKIDELIAQGHIVAKKSGKVLLIIYASLERYAEGLPQVFLQPPARIRRKLAEIEATLAPEKPRSQNPELRPLVPTGPPEAAALPAARVQR
jgi:excisionase family DNA binding protein